MNSKTLSIEEYVKRVEDCVPKFMRAMRKTVPKQVMETKLTFSQSLALIGLEDHDSIKMTDLSEKTSINLTALTGVVNSLINQNLAIRKRSSKDRRVVLVELSATGRKLVGKIQQHRRESLRYIVESLDKDEREVIIAGFEKMVETFHNQKSTGKEAR